jgi:hypothetical protein
MSAFAQVPSREPASNQADKQAIPADESPKDAMLRGSKVMEQLDLDAAIDLYAYRNDEEKQLVRSTAKCYIELTRIELAARKRFGRTASDAMIHAAGQKTDDDVREADYKVEGDKVAVQYKGDTEPALYLVKVKDVWKVDISESLKDWSKDELKQWAQVQEKTVRALAPVAAKLERGNYNSGDELAADVKKAVDEASASEN